MKLSGRIAKILREPALSANGWCVFLVDRDKDSAGRREPLLKCVGNFTQALRDTRIVMEGDFTHHPKYGAQFKARYIREAAPRSQQDLSSFLVDISQGLTTAEATRIVSSLGANRTVELLDRADHRGLADAARVHPVMARKITDAWSERRQSDELAAICHSLGLSREQSADVFSHFREPGHLRHAPQMIRDNPFRLAPIVGNQFAMLERMAQEVGSRLTTPERVDSAAQYALDLAARGGHCLLSESYFLEHVLQICNTNVAPAHCVSADFVVQRMERLTHVGTLTRATRDHDIYISLSSIGHAERMIASNLARLRDCRPAVRPDPAPQSRGTGFRLTAQQIAALDMVLAEKVCLLTGNPGTGKTTITRHLIDSFERDIRISLLAPTGQAADRLAAAAGRPASTIHLALGLAGHDSEPLKTIDADLVIVDEMSMVDVHLAHRLLGAISDEARVVLVGDPEQIPSIGPGAVLRDLMDSWIPNTHLTEIVRQKADSGILEVSRLVREGHYPFTGKRAVDAMHIPAADDNDCARKIVSTVVQLRRSGLEPHSIQVLVPWRHGHCGTNHLNQQLRRYLNNHPGVGDMSALRIRNSDVRLGDRVRHTRNDYDNGLLNGAVGTVTQLDESRARVEVDFRGLKHKFEPSRARNLQLDYATTIHRSQGSQYAATLLGISPAHKGMLDRRLLYTAITRAERLLITVAEPDALQHAISHSPHDSRQTSLSEYLADVAPGGAHQRMEATHGY